MNDRLKSARKSAGFPTATSAIDHFHWSSSTYRAHENGQNGFKVEDATKYGKAYGVSAAWLLTGEGISPIIDKVQQPNSFKIPKGGSLSKNLEKLEAIFILLKDDPYNAYYVQKLHEGIITYSQILQKN